MLRIGRQVQHSKNVDTSSIKASFSECNQYRYLLKFDFLTNLIGNNRDKKITVIMKNPSSADEKAADNTIRRVQEYVYANFQDVKTVYILNIFAIRATDAKDVNIVVKVPDDSKNDNFISDALAKSDYTITAWGGASGINKKLYDSRISQVQEILKSATCPIYRINANKGSEQYPFHFCFSSNSDELVKIA